MTIDETFLERWSRLKRGEGEPEEATEPLEEIEPKPAATTDEIVAQLPDIDSLGPGSDFKPFMQKGVPPELKRLALRKLWRLNPTIAKVDGLLDYDQDFTDGATVAAGLTTAYRVGRGMLADLEKLDNEAPSAEPQTAVENGSGDPIDDPEPTAT
ncbi:MAG: DUF3306 domain-containing protein [Geminicoccaceae bacterium]